MYINIHLRCTSKNCYQNLWKYLPPMGWSNNCRFLILKMVLTWLLKWNFGSFCQNKKKLFDPVSHTFRIQKILKYRALLIVTIVGAKKNVSEIAYILVKTHNVKELLWLELTECKTCNFFSFISEDLADFSYGNITKTMMLSSKENNAVVQCKLENYNLVLARALIFLRYKSE